jgi:hypothetical protein
MRRAILAAVFASAAVLVAAAPPPTPPPARPELAARPAAPPAAHGGDTDCGACHDASGWKPVRFAHDRTGFALEGRHRDVACEACHASGTFADPLPRACAACHRDVHLGRLGQRCGDCHAPTAWRATVFDPEAHRRTAFPLTGRHAALACEECHGDRRDRGFDRPVFDCVGCHEADWVRASGGGAAVDHDAVGFPRDCRGCHSTWRFAPAVFPAHEACFSIRGGEHAGVRCRDCHTTLPPVSLGATFACSSGTADCLRCHGDVDGEHREVPGYQRVNRKCYECHRFSGGEGSSP